LRRTAEKISSALGCPDNLELSILLTGDIEIQELNRKYRGKDEPTDVLSFPQHDDFTCKLDINAGMPFLLGDVVISVHRAAEQAAELGVTLNEELQRLLVHGFLHLAGFDHEKGEKERRRMRNKEKYIMARLNNKAR